MNITMKVTLSLATACLILVLGFTLYEGLKKKPSYDEQLSEVLTQSLEKAYFEGQQDALTGDVRIKNTAEGWVWIKSPWDGGAEPIYIPTGEINE